MGGAIQGVIKGWEGVCRAFKRAAFGGRRNPLPVCAPLEFSPLNKWAQISRAELGQMTVIVSIYLDIHCNVIKTSWSVFRNTTYLVNERRERFPTLFKIFLKAPVFTGKFRTTFKVRLPCSLWIYCN